MIGTIIHMRAISKGRPRLGRRRRAYTPQRTVDFEATLAEQWQKANPGHEPLEGPCGMQVIFGSNHIEIDVWELDASYRPKYMTADLDNLLKSVGDALNGVAFKDDKQLHHITVFFTKENFPENE